MISDRRLALTATSLLAAVAAIHLYWALGGTWALHAISTGEVSTASSGTRSFFAAIAALAILAGVEALVLGGVVRGPVLRRTAWAIVLVLVFGGTIRMGTAPLVGGAAVLFALLFALLAHDAPRGHAR